MATTRVLRNEIFEYPDTGDINYGDEASGWVGEATSILGDFSGPGDISTQETTLSGTSAGGYTTGTITNLLFDTAFVQRMTITGFITRNFSDATPTRIESYTIEGVYNGTVINYSVTYTGDDTDLEFTVSGGQFGFKYLDAPAVTSNLQVKFEASVTIDESFFP